MKPFALKPHALATALLLCAPFAGAHAATPPAADDSGSVSRSPFVPGGRIPLLRGDIGIDGNPDEAAWGDALVQEIAFDIQPGDNTPAPVKTTVRMGYTADALYLAFHAMDPDPSRIRAHLRDRDAAFNDDWVGVFLDTFNDHRRGYELIVNPLGVQADLIRDETNSNNQEDASWDGLWTSAGRLTADGYEVEVRIPFSTLRFPAAGGEQRWGISLFRNWPRDKRHQLTSHRVPRESNCFQCEWGKYDGLAGAQQGRNLEIVPTLTVGATQGRDHAGERWHDGDTSIEPGVDVSWAPSPAMTLNATLNPDFSQVETDQLQLELQRQLRPVLPGEAAVLPGGRRLLHQPVRRALHPPDRRPRLRPARHRPHRQRRLRRDRRARRHHPAAGAGRAGLRLRAARPEGRTWRSAATATTSTPTSASARSAPSARATTTATTSPASTRAGSRAATPPPRRSCTASRSIPPTSSTATATNWATTPPRPATPGAPRIRSATATGASTPGTWTSTRVSAPTSASWARSATTSRCSAAATAGSATARHSTASMPTCDFDITHRFDGQLLERELEAQVNAQGPMQSNLRLHGLTRARYWEGRLFDEHYVDVNASFRPNGKLQLGAYVQVGQMLDLAADRTGRRTMVELFGNLNVGRGIALDWDLVHQRMRRDGGTAFTASVLNAGGSWQFDPRQRLRLTVQGSKVDRDQALLSGRGQPETPATGPRSWSIPTRSTRAPRCTPARPTARSWTTTIATCSATPAACS